MLAALIGFAVRNRGAVLAIAWLILGYGTYIVRHAGLDIFPEFAPKQVIIQTEAPGLTAEQVELLVTQPIERRLVGLSLKHLRSESIQGLAVVTIVFDDASDIFHNRQQVSERLTALATTLPAGTGPPVLVPLSSSSATVLTAGVTAPLRSPMEIRDWVDWTLRPRLLNVPGVADVQVFGGAVRQLQVQPDLDRMWQLQISIPELLDAAQHALLRPGLGFIENTNQRLALHTTGPPVTPAALAEQVAARHHGVSLRLGDVAHIEYGPEPPISAAAVNGTPGVVMMVIGQYDANTLSVSRAVEAALHELQPLLNRQGLTLHPRLFRPADYIETAIRDLSKHLALGAALVVIVLYVFLYSVRTALIPALAIPLSLLTAVTILLHAGISLNLLVLGGLAIALGEVVDDAIIDTENIFRRLRENRAAPYPRPAAQVVFDASLEVRGSVVYATLIVALVFVPLLTLGGVAGRLFAPLGLAYIVAILASLVVALSVTPALCALLLTDAQTQRSDPPPLLARLQAGYSRVVARCLRAPGMAALATGVVAIFAGFTIPTLAVRFLPELREGHYIVHTSNLPGTALDEALRTGTQLVEAFRHIPGVVSASQWAGRAERGADTYGSHYSEYEIKLASGLSGAAQQHIFNRLRQVLDEFPGVVFEANTFLTERINETISGYAAPLAVNLYGPDLQQLDDVAAQVATLMRSLPGATQVQVRSPAATPVLDIDLKLDRLNAWGMRAGEVLTTVRTAFEGSTVGQTFHGDRPVPAVVILPAERRDRPAMVAGLPLRAPDGQMIRLENLADLRQTERRYNVLHQAGQRLQTVTCQLGEVDWDDFVAQLQRRVANDIVFPPGVYPEYTGAALEQAATRRELLLHTLLTGAGVLLLIYAALGSLRHVAITLANLPFALAGGVATVWWTGASVSAGSLVGFVTLFGITVRNSIMLITHYQRLVETEGLAWNAATALRGARERLPSILITALVTALAMLPIAIDSDNAGREIMGPMAAIIIGGLCTSTSLNLLLLPAILLRHGRFSTPNAGT